MSLTDLKGPVSVQPPRSGCGRVLPPFHFSAAVLIFSSLTFAASGSYAQDVAKAARQERARKQEQQKKAKHVYTNDDLKREQILTPEDQAAVEATKNECARNNNCAPGENPPTAVDANSQPGTSLGEVARQYRKQKELQAQKQKELEVLKPKQSQPFHLSIGAPALASPILPGHPTARAPIAPVIPPSARSAHGSAAHTNTLRRDPFAPVPARPAAPLGLPSGVRPTLRAPTPLRAPAAPKVVFQPSSPAKLPARPAQAVRPSQPASASNPTADAKSGEPIAPLKTPRQFMPVRPLLPPKTHGANSLPALKSVFPAAKSLTPLDSPSAQPAAPVASPVHSAVLSAASSVASTPSPISASSPSVALSSVPVSVARIIRVGQGDSLWKLAQRNLGYGSLWPMIVAANPGLTDPSHLKVGTELSLPAVVTLAGSSLRSTSTTAHTLKVHKGDTLWSLAKSNLGRSSDWRCLAAANPSLSNPGRIFDGQELLVPSVCGSARVGMDSLPHP